MALPTVFLKAKGALTKAKNAYGVAKTAKSIKDDSEQGENVLSGLKKMIFLPVFISGGIFLFIILIFVTLLTYPFIVACGLFPNSSANASTIATGNAASVVDCAREQLGDPYVWAAEGPDSFDCSGLVTYCYREALGVSIPHYTGSQMTDSHFQTVSSVDELSAGDIILRGGNPPSHVGIYTGSGTVIHAPHTGDVVKEVSYDQFASSGGLTFRHYIGE